MTTPDRNNERAAKLEAQSLKLRERAEIKSKKQKAIRFSVEPPTLDADGKIVKKRFEKRWTQFTIASRELTAEELEIERKKKH